jgi:hypothetical protein
MKKIFFALLSASMVLFAACQPAGPEVSDEAQVIEARDASYEVTVTSTGAWTLEGEYDWMTPSATSGNGGETITFTARVNLTDLIRTAEYTLKQNGGETVITLYQKGIKPDANVSVSLLENNGTSARFALNYSTAIEADYKEYGVYYGTQPDFAAATRKAFGTDMAAGVKVFELGDLADGQTYFVWPYVLTIDKVEVVGSMIGLLEPVKVTDITMLQEAIDEAPEYSEVRVVAGTYYTAEHGVLEMANNITVTGGWNSNFSAVTGYTVVDGQTIAGCVNFAEGVTGAALKNFEVRNVDSNGKGGIVLAGTNVTVANCYVHHCELGGDCGGIYLATGDATVANCKMTNNKTKGHGVGIHVSSGATVKMVNCLVADNVSTNFDGFYGGVTFKGSAVMVNCTIVKNYCCDENSGSCWPVNGVRDGAWLKGFNNLIVGNMARVKDQGEYQIQRLQFHFRDAWTSEFAFSNNILQGGQKGNLPETEAAKNNIIPVDYDLTTIFADFAGGDYTIKANDIVKDKGNETDANVASLLGVYNTDLAGNPRVKGKVDLGCYEIQ